MTRLFSCSNEEYGLHMSEPNVVFTYGTLRPGLSDLKEARAFRAAAKHIGPAKFQGKLFAIDWYPGAVDSNNPNDVVKGDLFEITRNTDFFSQVDIYEQCTPDLPEPHEYRRTIRNVFCDGQYIPAWIYLYNWKISDQPRIPTGDFADFIG